MALDSIYRRLNFFGIILSDIFFQLFEVRKQIPERIALNNDAWEFPFRQLDDCTITASFEYMRRVVHFFAERRAHAPLPAVAHVDHGVEVVIERNHRNRAAGSVCHYASC
jgi:hypothetical protein